MERKNDLQLATDYISPIVGLSTHVVSNNVNPTHTHDYIEIFYLLSGEIKHTLNKKEELLSSGDCYILGLNEYHSFSMPLNTSNRDIMVSSDFFLSCLQLLPDLYKTFINKNFLKIALPLKVISELETLFKEFSEVAHLEKKRCIAAQILMTIFLQAYSPFHLQNGKKHYPELIQTILYNLNKEYYIRGGIPALLEDCGYTQSYISKLFKKHLGITLSDYLLDIRLEHATYYLNSTEYSLRQIIELVGFQSLSYFHKTFKAKYSLTPIEYRKKSISPPKC